MIETLKIMDHIEDTMFEIIIINENAITEILKWDENTTMQHNMADTAL